MDGGDHSKTNPPSETVTIAEFQAALQDRLAELEQSLIKTEACLSEVLSGQSELTESALVAFQSLDHARQTSKDLHAMVRLVRGNLAWAPSVHLTRDAIRQVTDMQGSFCTWPPKAPAQLASDDPDIWL